MFDRRVSAQSVPGIPYRTKGRLFFHRFFFPHANERRRILLIGVVVSTPAERTFM